MKKYIAPMVQLIEMSEWDSLLVNASDPNKKVEATTPDGTNIPVMPSGSGSGGSGSSGPSTSGGNLDYAKKFDSWTSWDE